MERNKKSIRILVVDDHPYSLRVISTALKYEGYDVTCTCHPKSTWDHIRSSRPDVVLINCLSQEVNSYTLLFNIMCSYPDIAALNYVVRNSNDADRLVKTVFTALNEKRISTKNRRNCSDTPIFINNEVARGF